jgi:predicted RNA binding protein YcfA (HicA-like mRNA interferase family)
MKRAKLIEIVTVSGAEFFRRGGNHDIYINPKTGIQEPIARHRDIPEGLAKRIIKRLKAQH